MTIYVTRQLIVTLDSIRNSCDVLDGFVMTEKTSYICFRNFAIQFFVMDGEENMDSNSWMCPSGFPYLSPLELYSCQCGPAAVLLVTQTMP